MPYIYILPIETSTTSWIEPLSAGIRNAFSMQIKIIHRKIDLKKTFDPVREQYNSSQILLQIINKPPADAVKILVVVEIDLFIPILTFVFGEAQLSGIGAVVSLHRLDNKFYGLPENSELLSRRIVKESIHELGHTFGLLHCMRPGCVMNSSTYAEDVDQKSTELCMHCRQELTII
jgi:archaemetzincin